MSEIETRPSRNGPTRRSLLGAPAAGAAVALVAGVDAEAAEPVTLADKRQPRLHETDHTRAYYARARF